MSEKYEKLECNDEDCKCIEECPICLEDINLHKKYIYCKICNHKFHKKCIKKWEQKINSIYKQCVVCQTPRSLKKINPDKKSFRYLFCLC